MPLIDIVLDKLYNSDLAQRSFVKEWVGVHFKLKRMDHWLINVVAEVK